MGKKYLVNDNMEETRSEGEVGMKEGGRERVSGLQGSKGLCQF